MAKKLAAFIATVLIAVSAIAGGATSNDDTTAPQDNVTASSIEIYGFDMAYMDVLDEAQTMLEGSGQVDWSGAYGFAGKDKTGRYQYLIAATPASKSDSKRSLFSINVSAIDGSGKPGILTPEDESRAFMKELAERLHAVPIWIRDRKKS